MEETKEEIIIGPKQKAHPVKRILAGFFDMVIMFFATMGVYMLVASTPIANNYNNYKNEAIQIEDSYKLSTGYGEKIYLINNNGDNEGHIVYKEEGTDFEYFVRNVLNPSEEVKNAYTSAVNADDKHGLLLTYMNIHRYLMTAVISGGIVELLCIFVVPAIKSNGSTPGMWICGIRMVSTKDYERPKWFQYFLRFLFMYVVESLIPYFFIGQWTMVAVPVILLIVMFVNKKNKTLHDFIGSVMVIERIPRAIEETPEETQG